MNLSNIQIFMDNTSTLKETSLDNNGNTPVGYMTESIKQVIDFDKVKNLYTSQYHLSCTPNSVDALYNNRDGRLVFAEFKNGTMSPKKRSQVLKKAYDSVLIFNDISLLQINDLRKSAEFILVYNESKNLNIDDNELIAKIENQRQQTPAYDSIAKLVSKYANKEYICFGLQQLKGYCFADVHTYTESEYDEYIKKNDVMVI